MCEYSKHHPSRELSEYAKIGVGGARGGARGGSPFGDAQACGGEPTGFVRADGLAERERGAGYLMSVLRVPHVSTRSTPCEYPEHASVSTRSAPRSFVRADGLAERERGGELVLVVELVPCEYSQCPM